MRDGLPSNEFVINKHTHNTYTGQLLFGSANGLVEFDPDEFEPSPSVITPALSRVLVNYRPHPFYGDSVLHLTPDERNVSFEFTAIDFRNQDKIRYAYKLEGFDSTWHDIESYNRLANFTNLPYGDYTFMVRYRVSGEAWSKNILRVRLLIETPFYATWWFRIILIIAGTVLVALIVRYISQRRLRKQLEELKLQEEIRNEKERISRDLHDNVGAQLTYVISSLDNLSYTLHKKQTAVTESARLEQLGEFARGTMDQLRESIWAINSEQISLAELTGKWKQHLSQLSETKPLSGRVTRTGEDVIIKPTVAIEIHRIVQEAISNAFRHSGGDTIEINVHNDNRTLEITVSDNGIGIPPSPEKAGHYGLHNMKKRAEHIRASLDIFSGEKGAKITLRWKLN
jgi:signal transduction histidine kinase